MTNRRRGGTRAGNPQRRWPRVPPARRRPAFRAGSRSASSARDRCPGAATQNPNCTTPAPSRNGAFNSSYNGLVRYTGGANAFGGTMTMLVKGSGTLTVPYSPGPLETVRVLHLPMGGRGAQHPGAGYAASKLEGVPSGTVKQSPVYSPGGKIVGSVTPSPTLMAGYTTVLKYGFPWTTGQVYVRNTGTFEMMADTTTITATGSDMRSAGGYGSITMVAGGTTHGLVSQRHFADIDVVQMSFNRGDPFPSSSPAGLATGAVLMLLAVFYARRRRF